VEILEFPLGCDTDVAQDGAGKFGKEALDEMEPRAVLMRRVIVEDQLDRRWAG